MLLDFGFSMEKYNKQIERYKEMHKSAKNVDEIVKRWRMKAEAYYKWFIDKECDAVLEILRKIESEFTFGNSIYPSETPAKCMEFCERRKHIDAAVANCYILKQELNYIIRVLPVDLNKFTRFADAIDLQIALYKGVRQSDNRLLRKTKKENRLPNYINEGNIAKIVEYYVKSLLANYVINFTLKNTKQASN